MVFLDPGSTSGLLLLQLELAIVPVMVVLDPIFHRAGLFL